MPDKVFCKYCTYVRDAINTSIPDTNCAFPENIIGGKDVDTSNFYQEHRSWEIKYNRTANDINRNNDCKWYKHSFFVFWVFFGFCLIIGGILALFLIQKGVL